VSAQAKVGLFVILSAVILVGSIYYIGNEQWGRHVVPYRTYLRYAGGIEPGSDVLFGGIEAGRVNSVRAWSEDPTKIEISVEIKEGTPVNANSIAKLGTVSLMSSPTISITTGTNDAPRLKPGEVIQSEETVSLDDMARKLSGIADSAQGLITQIQGEIKGLSDRANTLLANLNDATGPVNREQIAEILHNANTMIAQLSPKINRIADQVSLTTQDADAAINKVGPLLDHADSTVMNVNSTVTNVNSTIDQIRDPLRQDLLQMQSTMEQAKSLIASVQAVVRGNDDNIQETIENLRVATENLAQLSADVKQRPWSLVRIRQPKDRKVPEQRSSSASAPSAH
jgi:phospholipid/cholesterol/gamma-HCH transport system substrate-binding protein